MASKRIAVVTGGNKGVGFGICKELGSSSDDIYVILTARDEKRGVEAVDKLKASGLSENIGFHQLDVTDPSSIALFATFIQTHFGKLDILVNNAAISGILVDEESFSSLKLQGGGDVTGAKAEMAKDVMQQTYETAEACIRTNYYGTKQVTQALLPLLQLSTSPRIVNISSALGKLKNITNEEAHKILSDGDGLTEEAVEKVVSGFLHAAKEGLLEEKGWHLPLSAYSVSKASINAYTRILAKKYPSFRVNAVSPGFVKTDMTHNRGKYSIEEGARGPVKFALVADDGPTGRYFLQLEESEF